jgi:hypothetical protein
MKTGAGAQRGISFTGFLMAAVAVAFLAIAAMKVAPAYFEAYGIQEEFGKIARDPEMKNLPVHDIQMAYLKQASVSNWTSLKAEDVVVDKSSGLALSASYTVTIPLVGNASLVLAFNPGSAH